MAKMANFSFVICLCAIIVRNNKITVLKMKIDDFQRGSEQKGTCEGINHSFTILLRKY